MKNNSDILLQQKLAYRAYRKYLMICHDAKEQYERELQTIEKDCQS